MRRGDNVLVRVYPNGTVERIVWDERNTYIMCCRREIYEDAIARGVEPESTMGFPKEDVKLAKNQAAMSSVP